LGIIAGLAIGKPMGIFVFSWVAVRVKMANLPQLVNWKHILAAGMLGGIGFTMSIFITLLAFSDAEHIIGSKIAILIASLLSALLGLFTFRLIR
jgi:NhaA family Na+:H+ antiporter